jgi:hypothetical protein
MAVGHRFFSVNLANADFGPGPCGFFLILIVHVNGIEGLLLFSAVVKQLVLWSFLFPAGKLIVNEILC